MPFPRSAGASFAIIPIEKFDHSKLLKSQRFMQFLTFFSKDRNSSFFSFPFYLSTTVVLNFFMSDPIRRNGKTTATQYEKSYNYSILLKLNEGLNEKWLQPKFGSRPIG